MAQITFFATDDDLVAIWGIIFNKLRMTAYPDPWFGGLPAPAIKTLSGVSANLAEYPRVAPALGYFLISPEWSVEALEYQLCENNPNFAPHWNVHPRFGGPSIHFVPRFGFPWHKERHSLISGRFSDYPHYYSSKDHRQVIERPAGLLAAMKSITQGLRSLGEIVRAPTGEQAIATRNALIAHEKGVILRTGDIVYSPPARHHRT